MQREAVAVGNGRGRRRSHIAAAVLLGCPRAAGFGQPVHAHHVVEKVLTHRLGRVRAQHISHGSGKGHRTLG